jgi:hypothetical protein
MNPKYISGERTITLSGLDIQKDKKFRVYSIGLHFSNIVRGLSVNIRLELDWVQV